MWKWEDYPGIIGANLGHVGDNVASEGGLRLEAGRQAWRDFGEESRAGGVEMGALGGYNAIVR